MSAKRSGWTAPAGGLILAIALAAAAVLGWWLGGQVRLDPKPLVAYFLSPDGLVAVPLRGPAPADEGAAARLAFQALCSGPAALGRPRLFSAVPLGCRVHRAWREGDTLHVAFSPGFDVVRGVPAANAWDDQMEMTAAQFPGIRHLQFWVDGRKLGGRGMPMPVDGRPNALRLAPPGRR